MTEKFFCYYPLLNYPLIFCLLLAAILLNISLRSAVFFLFYVLYSSPIDDPVLIRNYILFDISTLFYFSASTHQITK